MPCYRGRSAVWRKRFGSNAEFGTSVTDSNGNVAGVTLTIGPPREPHAKSPAIRRKLTVRLRISGMRISRTGVSA
jgi:hypothetical protein